jgi:hypothetical protein
MGRADPMWISAPEFCGIQRIGNDPQGCQRKIHTDRVKTVGDEKGTGSLGRLHLLANEGCGLGDVW